VTFAMPLAPIVIDASSAVDDLLDEPAAAEAWRDWVRAGRVLLAPPIIWPEAGEGPPDDVMKYVPTTWPGARLPHVWLDDGGALHDRIGGGYTLLSLRDVGAGAAALARAFGDYGAPFSVLGVPDERARAVYGYDLLLLRPDLHVVWRGNRLPDDPAGLAAMATGHQRSE
jgi:hypothetical protein